MVYEGIVKDIYRAIYSLLSQTVNGDETKSFTYLSLFWRNDLMNYP